MIRKHIYDTLEAENEAKRCLSCKNPLCETGCPIKNHIRDFIKEIKNKDLTKAGQIVFENSNLAFICSLVCPHENNCMGHCVLNRANKPINVGALEAYIAKNVTYNYSLKPSNGKKALIVGSGPAGIYAAIELKKNGFSVTLVEASNHIGGVLSYGIPNYRLPNDNLERIEKMLADLKVEIKLNTFMNEDSILLEKDNYDYILLACGLTKSRDANLGSNDRIIDALKLLKEYNLKTRYNEGMLPNVYGKVAVVGAGNVAMDASRVLRRLGCDVDVLYRRSREEAPATKEEIALAEDEGVRFNFLQNPVEAKLVDDKLELKMEKMTLGEPDSSGRRRPVSTNEFFNLRFDFVVKAIGQIPDSDLAFTKINVDHGYIITNDFYETNIENIYALGDLTLGAKTVVEACVSAKCAVENIILKENI